MNRTFLLAMLLATPAPSICLDNQDSAHEEWFGPEKIEDFPMCVSSAIPAQLPISFEVARGTTSISNSVLVKFLGRAGGNVHWTGGMEAPTCQNRGALKFLWQTVAMRSGEGFRFAARVIGICQFREAINDLRDGLANQRFRHDSAVALYFMGDSLDLVLPIVLEITRSPLTTERRDALAMIMLASELRPPQKEETDAVGILLNDSNETILENATHAMLGLPIIPDSASAALVRNLSHGSPTIRATSACVLIKMHQSEGQAEEVLRQDLLHPEFKVCSHAIGCLAKIGGPKRQELLKFWCENGKSPEAKRCIWKCDL